MLMLLIVTSVYEIVIKTESEARWGILTEELSLNISGSKRDRDMFIGTFL